MIDYDRLSNADLQALSNKNLDAVSTEGLKVIAASGKNESEPQQNKQNRSGWEATKSMVGDFYSGIKGGIKGIPNIAKGVAQGGVNSLINAANFAPEAMMPFLKIHSGVGNWAPESIMSSFSNTKLPQLPKQQFVDPKSLAGQAGNLAGEIGAFALPSTGLNKLGMGTRALGNAALGASQSPDNRALGAGLGAGLSIIPEAAMAGISKGIKKFASPTATAQEAEKVLQAFPQNMRDELPIGEVVGSTPMKGMQKTVLENLPFSGMGEKYGNIHKYVQEEGKGIYDALLKGKDPNYIQKNIFESVQKSYDDLLKQTDKAYKNFSATAERTGTQFNSVPIKDAIDFEIKTIQDIIKSNPRRADKYKDTLDALEGYKNTEINGFKGAENFRRDLNADYREALASGDSKFLFAIKNIRTHLTDSFENSAKANPEVYQALKDADALFKKSKKYEESVGTSGKSQSTDFFKLYKEQKKGKDINLDNFISGNLKTGKNKDYADTLENLLKLIPDQEGKDLVAAYYLRGAMEGGKINPSSLIADVGKLGEKQRKLLFPEMNERLSKLETIGKTYPEAMQPNFIPKTGVQLAHSLPLGTMVGGAGMSLLHGNIPGAAASLIGLPVAGMAGRKMSTSPAIRDYLLGKTKSIGHQKSIKAGKYMASTSPLLASLFSGEEQE